MKILFHDNGLGIRGTTQALFDFAYYNETILGNESVIFYDSSHHSHCPEMVQKFREQFDAVHPYSGDFHERLDHICQNEHIEACYFIKSGLQDGKLSRTCRNLVHAVFQDFDPHGDVYAYISQWLSAYRSNGHFPYVPFVVTLPEPDRNLREQLAIPDDAFVFGRHGGVETFDIAFVKKGVANALKRHNRLYFLFLNTEKFIEHPRVIFLDSISNRVEKANFISSCDAMIHGRHRGESFGLAICEFLYFNKPVLSWRGGIDQNHLSLLEHDQNLLYRDKEGLAKLIDNLIDGAGEHKDFSRLVGQYSPQNVMSQFHDVFLDPSPQPLHSVTEISGFTKFRINKQYQLRRWARSRFTQYQSPALQG